MTKNLDMRKLVKLRIKWLVLTLGAQKHQCFLDQMLLREFDTDLNVLDPDKTAWFKNRIDKTRFDWHIAPFCCLGDFSLNR